MSQAPQSYSSHQSFSNHGHRNICWSFPIIGLKAENSTEVSNFKTIMVTISVSMQVI